MTWAGEPASPRPDGSSFSHRTFAVVGLMLFASVLGYVYQHTVAPIWGYLGFASASNPTEWQLLGVVLAAIPGLVLPMQILRPSAAVAWLLTLLVHVPVAVVPSLYSQRPEAVLPFQFGTLIAIMLVATVPTWPALRVDGPAVPRLLRATLFSLFTVALYFVAIRAFGARLPDFSLSSVYVARAEYKDQVAGAGRLAAYAVGWIGFAVNPVLIGYGAKTRRAVPVLLGIVGQLWIFGLTGYKNLLLTLVLMVVVAGVAKSRRSWLAVAPLLTAFVVLAADAVSRWTGELAWVSMLVRRLISMPGLLSVAYVDFFSQRPPVAYGHSILDGIVGYPFFAPYPQLISAIYLRGDEGSANANFLADAYANLWVPGTLLAGFLLAFFLWIADAVLRRFPPPIGAAVLIVPASVLVNSALNTSLVTHGLLIVLPLVWLVSGSPPDEVR